VDAAACDDSHITVIAHVKVIVDHLFKPCLAHDHRDMDTLFPGAVLDANDDSVSLFSCGDLDMLCAVSAFTFSVRPDVVCAHRDFMQPGHCFQ
jgi:hypothetical protein